MKRETAWLVGVACLVTVAIPANYLANRPVLGAAPATIENRTGQAVRVTLLTRNSAGKIHVLPQSVTGKRKPWQWRQPRDVEIADGASLTNYYHWSDFDLTWLAVRGADGKLRALPHPAGPQPDVRRDMPNYYPPGKPIVLQDLVSLPLAPPGLL